MINARYVDGLELRIKELSKKLSDESNSALHLIAENKSLKAERDAMAAQVAGIKDEISDFSAALDGMMMADLSSEEIADDLEQRLSNYDVSQHHLRELRAEAVTEAANKMGEAFILPANLRRETQKAEFYKAGWRDAFLFLKQYADNIRNAKDGE